MMRRERLIEAILRGFDKFEKSEGVKSRGGGTWWTRSITDMLCRVGEELGLYVCASPKDGKHRSWGEWLFDDSWLDWEGYLRLVPMVAECEWGDKGHIRDDFQKLLVARAGVRLMVCDAGWMRDSPGGTAGQLCKWIDAFEGTQLGDTYLLVEWKRDEASGLWRSRRYRISASGKGFDTEPIELLRSNL